MTVSEFAIQMYHCDIIKDRVKVKLRDGEVLYDDRMEFLRYANEYHPDKMWFAGELIQEVKMVATCDVRELDCYAPDYYTEIII